MTTDERQSLGLRYLTVANSLRQKIRQGTYGPGDRLPKQHELAREHNVSFSTLKYALDILDQEGYLLRKAGQGTYATVPEDRNPMGLVVDDEEGIRGFLARALDTCGWAATAVQSGEMAIEKWNERRFDLTFLDLVMPGMNGAQTFREIQEVDPQANVVIITAYPHSDLMAEALEVGPFAVMRKPFTLDEIRMVLDRVVIRSTRGRVRSR